MVSKGEGREEVTSRRAEDMEPMIEAVKQQEEASEETTRMPRREGREGVAYHEEPNSVNGGNGTEGITPREEEQDVESKTETDKQENGMEDSSEEDAANEGDGDDSEYPSDYVEYQGMYD